MSSSWWRGLLLVSLVTYTYSAPVDPRKKDSEGENNPNSVNEELPDYKEMGIEYSRYLHQVVSILESDPTFKDKLTNATEEDIKSGAIARHLESLGQHVRSKLDEAKRLELERLKSYVKKQHDIDLGSYGDRKWRAHPDPKSEFAAHMHDINSDAFEQDDLKKLIKDTSEKMEKWDKKRREEFKEYELEKEHQYRENLKNMTEDQRKEAMKKHEDAKHKKHEKVHHPGSKQQLEEVWEKEDHMDKNEFDPKTFFAMHDLDGNGFLDEEEVKALLTLEIRKLYDENDKNTDLNEMHEEYERMREHVYKEGDKDDDRLISRAEFLDLTKRPEFEKDPEWKGIPDEPQFNEHEVEEYEKNRGSQPHGREHFQYEIPHDPYFQMPPTPPYHYDPNAQFQGHPNAYPPQYQHYPQQPPPGYHPPPPPEYHQGQQYPPNPQYAPQGAPQGAQYGYNQGPPQGGHPAETGHGMPPQYQQGAPIQHQPQGGPQFQPPHPGVQAGQGLPPQQPPQYQHGAPAQHQAQGAPPPPQYQHPAGSQNANIPSQQGVAAAAPSGSHPNVASPQGVPSSQPNVASNQGNPNAGGYAAQPNSGYQQPKHN